MPSNGKSAVFTRSGLLTMLSSKGFESRKSVDEAMITQRSTISIRNTTVGRDVAVCLALENALRNLSLLTTMGSLFCSSGVNSTCRAFGKSLAVGSLLLNAVYYFGWYFAKPCTDYEVVDYPGSLVKDTIYGPPEIREEPVTLRLRSERCLPLFQGCAALGCTVVAFWSQLSTMLNLEDVFGDAHESGDDINSNGNPSRGHG